MTMAMAPMEAGHDQSSVAFAKVGVAWVGLVIGGLTLSNIALVLTIVFTGMQIWRFVRNELRERRKAREESAKFEARLRAPLDTEDDA